MRPPIEEFAGKLALQQRVLPDYRVPFFEELARHCAGGFSLFAGQPRPGEAIKTADTLWRMGQYVPRRESPCAARAILFMLPTRHSCPG